MGQETRGDRAPEMALCEVRRLDGCQALGSRRPNLPTGRPTLREFPKLLLSSSLSYSS
jgi:hypothetical protein